MQSSITAWLQKNTAPAGPSQRQAPPHELHANTSKADTALSAQIEQEHGSNQVLANKQASQPGFRRKAIPSNASIQTVTTEMLPEFRRMIQLLLPISYPDKFFNEILADPVVSSVTRAAVWTDRAPSSKPQVVAGIRGRVLARSPCGSTSATSPVDEQSPCLYIATLGTLAPYRCHGLASAMLRQVTARAIEDHGVRSVTAHVWEANDEARAWYSKLGFTEVLYEPAYYRRLRPSGAYLLERKVRPSDLLHGNGIDFNTSYP